MRKSFSRSLSCALISFIPLSSAHAIDQDIELTATVEPSCTLSGSAAPSAMSAAIPVSNGVISTTPITIDVPIACNTAASLVVGSLKGGLRRPDSANWPQMAHRIDYTAQISSPFYMAFSLDTEPASGQIFSTDYAPSGPPTGNIAITITPKQPPLPLHKGTYSDTLRVTITPSQ